VNGDFYIDTSAWTIYGPKTGAGWGVGTSLVGPAGPGEDPVYIHVSDATVQSVAVANTFQDVTWSTNGVSDGFTHVPGTASILAPRTGVFQLSASLPMRRTGLAITATGTACLAVNGTNVACQSAGFAVSDLIQGLPLTAIVSLNAGDVVTVRLKGTATNIQIAGTADSTSVITIASVD
jgi:hypothetical protein